MSPQESNNESLVVVANAIDLVSKVVLRVAGDAIANATGDVVATTINGERVTPALLNAAIAAKLQTRFAAYLENK